MGFVKYYYNRYQRGAALIYKMIISACTIISCVVMFPNYNRNYHMGCAKDALFTLMGRYVFPFIALVSLVSFFLLTQKDSNSNIVLRYASKRKLWTYQSFSGVVFGMESALITYISAIVTGYLFFGVYDIWTVEGSYFYTVITKYKYPLNIGISDAQMLVLILTIKVIILAIASNITLLVESLTNESRIAVLTIVIFCGVDYVTYTSIIGFFDFNILDLYNVSNCIKRIVAAFVCMLILFFSGLYICQFRQYYKKHNEY